MNGLLVSPSFGSRITRAIIRSPCMDSEVEVINRKPAPMLASEALVQDASTESESAPTSPADPDSSFKGFSFTQSAGPSSAELLVLAVFAFAIFISIMSLARGCATAVDNFGDSPAYMSLASAIRRWDFRGIEVKQFWGLPYAMAALAKLSSASDRTALLVISLLSSLLAVILARHLWNGWIAAYFAILNFDWLQRSCLGGSEPLFMAFLLAAFVSVRQRRWMLASLLAALATIVRPLGVFALVGIGLTLLWKKDFRRFACATAIGLAVGVLYALPLATHFGDPLATVNSYHSQQWQGGWLFGIPFYAIIKGTIIYPAPWTNLVLSFGWVFLVVGAVVVMVKSLSFREYCRSHSVEAIFLAPYLWCLFTYNYPYWARGNFARFAIPILPFVLLALYRWLPKDRRVLWGLGIVAPALAAVSALGVVNVVQLLHKGPR